MTSPTSDLEVHVTAEALTDPALARRLARCFVIISKHERRAGEIAAARFIDALIDSLDRYADELDHAYDEVVGQVTRVWFKRIDEALTKLLGEDEEAPE